MPIIEARLIRKHKGRHCCEECGKRIDPLVRKVAIFGYAEGERPGWLYFHFDCVKDQVGNNKENFKMDQVIAKELEFERR